MRLKKKCFRQRKIGLHQFQRGDFLIKTTITVNNSNPQISFICNPNPSRIKTNNTTTLLPRRLIKNYDGYVLLLEVSRKQKLNPLKWIVIVRVSPLIVMLLIEIYSFSRRMGPKDAKTLKHTCNCLRSLTALKRESFSAAESSWSMRSAERSIPPSFSLQRELRWLISC